jgi:hypothetical protein
MSSVKGRIKKLERMTVIMAEPQPGEVAEAMMDFHEHGEWGTRPQVKELAERLMANSQAGMALFDEGRP